METKQKTSSRAMPTSFETVRVATLSFMKQCIPHMAKFRDRENLQREIERLQGFGGNLHSAMKRTGMVRKVDDLGRVVIPIELRRLLSITERDAIEIYTDDEAGEIYLKKYNMMKCCVCEGEEDISPFKGRHICESCVSELFDTMEVGGRQL